MKVLIRVCNNILVIFLVLFLLFFIFEFYPIFTLKMLTGKYESFGMELFVKILFSCPPFVIFGIPFILLRNNSKSLIKKINIYIILSASLALMFFVGALRTAAQNEYYAPKHQSKIYNYHLEEKNMSQKYIELTTV